MPLENIKIATLFKSINALSCHNIPTTNQPETPTKCVHIFQGSKLDDVNPIPTNLTIDETHFIYQDKSYLGVTFL